MKNCLILRQFGLYLLPAAVIFGKRFAFDRAINDVQEVVFVTGMCVFTYERLGRLEEGG